MRDAITASPAARVLLFGACTVVLAAGMQAAATLVSAIVLAIVLAVVLAPILQRLRAGGLPGWLAGIVVLAPVVLIGVLFVGFLLQSLVDLNANIPGYATRLAALADVLS